MAASYCHRIMSNSRDDTAQWRATSLQILASSLRGADEGAGLAQEMHASPRTGDEGIRVGVVIDRVAV